MKKTAVIGFILLIALTLRLYNLNEYSLSYDETITVLDERGLNQLPCPAKLFDENFLIKHYDFLLIYNHGFVYYWQKLFGKSEFTLRLSAVIFSILSIYVLYLLSKKIFGFKTACLVSLLISISPFHIYYSQELRQYTAVSFLTLTAAYSFLMLLKSSEKKFFIIYIITNVLNIYFHYTTLLVLVSFCVFFVFNIKKLGRLLNRVLLTHAIILSLVIPVLLAIYPNVKFALHNPLDPDFCEYPIWAGKVGFQHLLFAFKNFSIGYNKEFISPLSISGAVFYFLLFLIGVLKYRRKSETILFFFCLFIPILSLFFISQVKSCFVDRYFFSVFPFYFLFIALGLSRLNKIIAFISMALIITLNFLGMKNYYQFSLPKNHMEHVGVPEKEKLKGIAKTLLENYKKGDMIVHTCRNTIFPLKFYIRQLSYNSDLIQEIDRGSIIFKPSFYKDNKLYIYNWEGLYPTLVLPGEFKMVKNYGLGDRLWLIFSNWYFMDSNNKEDYREFEAVKYIRENYEEDKREEFYGAHLYLFIKNNLRNKK